MIPNEIRCKLVNMGAWIGIAIARLNEATRRPIELGQAVAPTALIEQLKLETTACAIARNRRRFHHNAPGAIH